MSLSTSVTNSTLPCLLFMSWRRVGVKMYGIIYKVTNVKNGKVYIGQTTQELWARKAGHKFHADVKDNIFARAIRKYGFESFEWEIIDKAEDRDDLNRKEIYWISFYSSHGVNGYNETDGGEGTVGYTVKDETKAKMSKTRLERISTYKNTKLNEAIVAEIKMALMSEKYTQVEIADMFGQKKNAINNIKRRVRWEHVFVEGFNEWSESTSGHSVRIKKQSSLDENKVKEIKRLLTEGSLMHRDIAEMFNITIANVENIKYGKAWKHV